MYSCFLSVHTVQTILKKTRVFFKLLHVNTGKRIGEYLAASKAIDSAPGSNGFYFFNAFGSVYC